jgi:hypothetical protein
VHPKKFSKDIESILQQPGQIPVHVVKSDYYRMMGHCKEEHGVWACKKGGARAGVKVWVRDIYERDTGALIAREPIGHMFCTGCDKPPNTDHAAVWADEITTVAM